MRHLFLMSLLLLSPVLVAHEIRPALLQITQKQEGHYDVVWKRPVSAGQTIDILPELPSSCTLVRSRPDQTDDKAWNSFYRMHCDKASLAGETLSINGLSMTVTDALVRINWMNGSVQNYILKPDSSSVVIENQSQQMSSGHLEYFKLGIEHLITGIDHVLFVLGLLYLGKNGWVLLKIITSFTIAHSITLGLSAMNVVQLSQRPVEAVIALSILYLARELLNKNHESILFRQPWLIAFIFGLLHGFGFAGALREIGLPEESIVSALLLFNVGVEVGQLVIVAAGLLFIRFFTLIRTNRSDFISDIPAWIIGITSTYWLIERSIAIVTA